MKQYTDLLNNIITIAAPDRRVFALVPDGFAHRTLAVRSRAFRDWFLSRVWASQEHVPSGQAWGAICRNYEAQAASDPDRRDILVGCRVDARHEGGRLSKILLDLTNPAREFVEITAAGWKVTTHRSTHFEELPFAAALPSPAAADSAQPHPLDLFRAKLRLDRRSFLRCLAWLLTALNPEAPCPILILRGPAGSGKSIAARMLRALIDPSTSRFAPPPSTCRQLTDIALQNYVLAFDHVSSLPPRVADALCRLSSGGAILHREPGHREPVQIWLRRPILLTATEDFTTPPDLADRALRVTLPPMPPELRATEAAIFDSYEPALPALVSMLCDAVSAALRDPVPVEPHPTRHMDALAWTLSAATVLRYDRVEIRDALQPEPNPIVQAIQSLLRNEPQWSGTATDLRSMLPITSSPRLLSQDLHSNASALKQAGITLDHRAGHGGKRIFVLSTPPRPQQIELKADS